MTRMKLGDAARSLIEITNIHNKTIAFKVKTTAPKLFVVKPICGVIPPAMTAVCKVQLLVTKTPDGEAAKNKFMI